MSDPFKIEGPACLGVSGGRTSAYMLYRVMEAWEWRLPRDVRLLFQNTGDECEETLVFLHEIEKRWRVPLVWLEYSDTFILDNYQKADGSGLKMQRGPRDFSNPWDRGFKIANFHSASRAGEPYDKMIDYYGQYRVEVKDKPRVLPNPAQRMCTAHLKIKLQTQYMRHQGYEQFDAVAGIRWDEPQRWSKLLSARENHFEYVLPLMQARVTKQEVLEFWNKQEFDLALDADAVEGNCRLCFLKKKSQLVKIMRKEVRANGNRPTDEIMRWIGRESRTGARFRNDRPGYGELLVEALGDEEIPEGGVEDGKIIDCICGE